ncbi:MAG: FAD-dependent oxidoreductase [Coriobacteriia bacterium]
MDSENRNTEETRNGSADFSRRSFLKAAATLGIAAAAGPALAGCGKGTQSAEASEEASAAAAFEAAAAPIPPVEPPAKWDFEADIIVVGSGAGGMNASIRLAKADYQVIMLERNDHFGGNSRHSSIFSNFGGHKNAEAQKWAFPSYPYDIDNIVEYVMDAHQMTGDPELFRAMAIEGPNCINWMNEEAGAKWVPMAPVPAGNGLLHWDGMETKNNHININFGAFEALGKTAKDSGVDMRLKTPVAALVKDGEKIVGVKAVGDDDKTEYYHAKKAVILTAGGFEVNRAMMAKYSPTCLKGIACNATPPNGTGECIRMGLGVGADLAGYDSTGAFDGGVWWREPGKYDTLVDCHINKDGNQALRQPWLRINKFGQRVPYLSSSGTSYPYSTDAPTSSAALCDQATIEMSQPDGQTFVCFDSKYEELVLNNFFGQAICRKAYIVPADDPFVDRVPEWQRDWRTGFELMVKGGAIKKCSTIEELESALGLRKGVLVAEVEKWNAACVAGVDYVANYKYKPAWLIAIDKPPYYGAKLGGHVFGSKCGLAVNPKMQVLDENGDVIPGLYAGWHTAGGSSGDGNPAGRPLTGMYADLGLSFVGGYMAAGGVMAEDA